jgi:PAS domain S-box-containing protein
MADDVSNPASSEQNIRDSEARTRAILDTVVDGIITINEQGIIETVNPATQRIFGYSAEEMVGQNVKMLMPAPYHEEHDGYLSHYVKTGEKHVIGIGREVQGQRKDGSVFPLELAVSEMEVAGQRMFTGIIRDISERVEAERVIHDKEARTRAIVETVVDGIITISERGIIETVNPATQRIFGYSAEEMVGQNVKMLMPAPYHEEHDGYLSHYVKTGEKHVIGIGREVQGQRKDGSVFSLELAVSEMEVAGQRMFTGIIRDITERKQTEKMKEEFISTVSHELRTPLTSIRGSLGLLIGGAVGDIPEKAVSLLDIAHKNTERLLLLINDILDMSKLESGKMDINLKEVKVRPFLEHAIEANASYATQHNVTYELGSCVDDAVIQADEDRMMQVMSNLMSNAAKFAPADSHVEISAVRHKHLIRISVTDHGCGIKKEFASQIFEKFTQQDSSDTRRVGGTGLGLNITKSIIEKHGGYISFVSEEGVGTTFYFDLPELKESGKLELPEEKGVHRLALNRVLICEDEPDIAALLRLLLAQSGYEADVANSAEEAEALMVENDYAALTLDIMLPDKDGVTFYKELRENPRTADMPVVIVSAKADQAKQMLDDDAASVIDWLSKPIDENRLLHAMHVGTGGSDSASILHVEDDKDIQEVVRMLLQDKATITFADNLQQAREQLDTNNYDLVLLDIGLPDGSGLDLIPAINELKPAPEIVVFSADDIAASNAGTINTTLIKSRTSNTELVDTISRILSR